MKILRKAAYFLGMLFCAVIMGCTQPKYKYDTHGAKENTYRVFANYYAMKEFSGQGDLNTCYYKNKCIDILEEIIASIVSKEMEPIGLCKNGFKIIENTILFTEHGSVQAYYYCINKNN